MIVTHVDGMPVRLKEPFDFGFLGAWGKVFRVFDDQDSGNLCFGTEKDGQRFFVKFAGAPTVRATDTPEEAVKRLRAAEPLYRDLEHENLVRLLDAGDMGGGFALVFRWAQGDCMGRMYPQAHERFMALPVAARKKVYTDVLDFLENVHARGYVAVDFYDGSLLYDFESGKTTICDIDFFRRQPCVNDMGRMWGSSKFQAPEEYRLGAAIDAVTNVYTAGAMAFALFGNYERTREVWQLSDPLFAVASRAVEADRDRRQRSIGQLKKEWEKYGA